MKKTLSLLLTAATLSLVGCAGASPEAPVTCGGVTSLTLEGPGTGYRRALISTTISDPGLGGSEMPLNNSPVTVYAEDITAFDLVGVCQGSFTDCSTDAGYDNTVELETDENGMFDFFVRLSSPATPGFSADGSIVMLFGSTANSCQLAWDVSTP